MRLRILIVVLVLFLVISGRSLNLIQAQDSKNIAAITSYASIQVTLKRSTTESITFSLDNTRHFECMHTWTHEVPASAITTNSLEKLELWSKKTVTTFKGVLSEIDCHAFNEAYRQLPREAIRDISEEICSLHLGPTWVFIDIETTDKHQIIYGSEYQKYGENADKIEAFLKVVLALTERLK